MSGFYELWTIAYSCIYGLSSLQIPGEQIEIINEFIQIPKPTIGTAKPKGLYFHGTSFNQAIKLYVDPTSSYAHSKHAFYVGYLESSQKAQQLLVSWCLELGKADLRLKDGHIDWIIKGHINEMLIRPMILHFNFELDLVNLCFLHQDITQNSYKYTYCSSFTGTRGKQPQGIVISNSLFNSLWQSQDFRIRDFTIYYKPYQSFLGPRTCIYMEQLLHNLMHDNKLLFTRIHNMAPGGIEMMFKDKTYMMLYDDELYAFIDRNTKGLEKEGQSTQRTLIGRGRSMVRPDINLNLYLGKFKEARMHESDLPTALVSRTSMLQ